MPALLRILLFVSSLFSLLFVIRSIRKTRVQLYDTIFWIFLSALFVLLSVFPQIAISLAEIVGVQSPVNLVYLIIIFVLLGHCFLQSLRVSRLEEKVNTLVSELALRDLHDSEDIAGA